jgi:nitrite reductase/ring-hydroxylating ferredoxin subunit
MNDKSDCMCFIYDSTRRTFLVKTSCSLLAAFAASGISISAVSAAAVQGSELSYELPLKDGVHIDSTNEVILVRNANHVYVFALSCPHENTALRWQDGSQQFQCPRHHSKYQPDGTFVSGRATRNMDRFALRLADRKVAVDLSKLYRSDRQKSEWSSALLNLQP